MKFVGIKSINKREKLEDVYDITINKNHNFFANGILSHNCHNYGTARLLPYLKYPFKYKVGLSATLERMDQAHWEIIEYFDYNVFKYSPQQALNEGILNPFYFTNVSIEMDEKSMDEYNVLTKDINLILQAGGGFMKITRSGKGIKYKLLSKMNKRKDLVNNYPMKFEVIKDICKKHEKDTVLVFNQFNKQTNRCYWYLLDVGIKARIIHSGVERSKREEILSDFKNGKFSCLLSTKVLDEGWNLPKLDVGVIAAGDSSPKQTIQRMGRILRKKDKYSYLYQIYCKHTIEEDYSNKRAKLFKELCTDYKEYDYNQGVLDETRTRIWTS